MAHRTQRLGTVALAIEVVHLDWPGGRADVRLRSCQRPAKDNRNATISSPLRTSRTSATSTRWFQVLPSSAIALAVLEVDAREDAAVEAEGMAMVHDKVVE